MPDAGRTPRPQARVTVQVDEAHVRVTLWRFAPGEATGFHTHEYDYVVVPVVPGTLTIEDPSGATSDHPIALGASYARRKGVSHDVINASDAEVAFVEVEMKG